MVFGFLAKKTPSVLDELIRSIYGPNLPRKTAVCADAARLAHEDLLGGMVPFSDVESLAKQLNAGPIPYSTCDLAASVAMNFLKRDELRSKLKDAQLLARMTMLDWVKGNRLNKQLASAYEDVLYRRFSTN